MASIALLGFLHQRLKLEEELLCTVSARGLSYGG